MSKRANDSILGRVRRLRSVLPFALAAGAATVATGCYREATDSSTGAAVSKGPWRVNGLRLGMTDAECRVVLGDPAPKETTSMGKTVRHWGDPPRVTVVFDTSGNGTACEIVGDTLTDMAGNVAIWGSAGEEEVRAILPDARVDKQCRPTGSGVISLRRTHVGTSYTCEDDSGSYCISYYEGQFANIRALRP